MWECGAEQPILQPSAPRRGGYLSLSMSGGYPPSPKKEYGSPYPPSLSRRGSYPPRFAAG